MDRNYLFSEEKLQAREKSALADMAELSRAMWRGIKHIVITMLPWWVRGGCVGTMVIGGLYSFTQAWTAFGGDAAALIPAALLGIIPSAAALINGTGYGGMFLAGFVSMIVGHWLNYLPFEFRFIPICVLIGLMVVIRLKGSSAAVETPVQEQNEEIHEEGK